MSHSLYFLIYAVIGTVSTIIIFLAQYSRYRKDGTPFNYTILKICIGVSLAMWTGAAQTIYFYDITPDTAAWAAFALGITISVFIVWEGSRLMKKIQSDGRLIEELSSRDALTGLWNLRIFHECLNEEFAHSGKTEEPFSLVMFHFDNLPDINEKYGYKSGDMVLRQLGERLLSSVNQNDRLCLYKSATFALVLPRTGVEEAQEVAIRMSALLEAPLRTEGNETPVIIWSVGISTYTECTYPQQVDEKTAFVSRAFSAMRTAQEQGGNRICFSEKGACREVKLPTATAKGGDALLAH